MDARTAKVYIVMICIMICLLLGYAGPAMFLGEYFPCYVKEPTFVAWLFTLYLWGDKLLTDGKVTPEAMLAVNTFTSIVWGMVVGWVITMIAVKKNTIYRRNDGESDIQSYS